MSILTAASRPPVSIGIDREDPVGPMIQTSTKPELLDAGLGTGAELCDPPGAAVDSGEGTLGDSVETDPELQVVGLGREFRCAAFWRRLKEARCSIAGGGVLGHGRRCGTATSVTWRRS